MVAAARAAPAPPHDPMRFRAVPPGGTCGSVARSARDPIRSCPHATHMLQRVLLAAHEHELHSWNFTLLRFCGCCVCPLQARATVTMRACLQVTLHRSS
jgi:hypothetical protein